MADKQILSAMNQLNSNRKDLIQNDKWTQNRQTTVKGHIL